MYVHDHVVCMYIFDIAIVAVTFIVCWRSCDHPSPGGGLSWPELGYLDSMSAADSRTCQYDILFQVRAYLHT